MYKKEVSRRKRENLIDSDISDSKIFIPSCIFNKKLSSFETIVKFLKEGYNFNFEKISKLLNKKKQSVWRAYKNSEKKLKQSFEVTNLHYPVSVHIFKDSKYSLLENLVLHLKQDHNLSFAEISALLMRDERTIWTAYDRVRSKLKT